MWVMRQGKRFVPLNSTKEAWLTIGKQPVVISPSTTKSRAAATSSSAAATLKLLRH